jgi:prepilin-type N-terminal cleavage/methylation domain-containing protein/prepilin-type processing-associated H-X9-DG protein
MKKSVASKSNKLGFTLIELLVVIAIIAILAAILFPVFAQAKAAAKKTQCLSNTKQVMLGEMMYIADVDDVHSFAWGWDSEWLPWHKQINPYIKNVDLWKSPVDTWDRGQDAADNTKRAIPVTYSQNFTWPFGNWGWSANAPQYLMSPAGANAGTETAPATTIFLAPRPNWYHQLNAGWATEVFHDYSEFNMKGGGATMHNGGANYAFCDGHSKYMKKDQTTKPLGNQATDPAFRDPADGPWPNGMWDKRQ